MHMGNPNTFWLSTQVASGIHELARRLHHNVDFTGCAVCTISRAFGYGTSLISEPVKFVQNPRTIISNRIDNVDSYKL